MKNKIKLSLAMLIASTLVGCGSSEKRDDDQSSETASASPREETDEIFESAGSEDATKVESASDVGEEAPAAPAYTADNATSSTDNYNEPAPAPEKKSKPAKKSKRPASHSGGAFKAKMYSFSSDCEMKSEPSDESASAGNVKAGKKLWVENHDAEWAVVQKKSGPVYVRKSCL